MRSPDTCALTLLITIALLCATTAALACPSSWYMDSDQDGFGDPLNAVEACEPPPGFVAAPGDCDDTDAAVHPTAAERCDGVDNNCDGSIDAEPTPLHPYGEGGFRVLTLADGDQPPGDWLEPDFDEQAWALADEDGLGAAEPWCLRRGPGWPAAQSAFVRHRLPQEQPSKDLLVEIQAGGMIEGVWFNGHPISGPREMRICAEASSHTLRIDSRLRQPTGDVLAVHLRGDDTVGSYDHRVSASLTRTHFADFDGDGVGDPNRSASVCPGSPGWVTHEGDCDDRSAAVWPGADELCDGLDNDCDGQVDGMEQTCQTACGESARSCNAGRWGACTAPTRGDELCDGRDNDCDGDIDESPEACGVSEACWCEQERCDVASDCSDPTHSCQEGVCVGADGPGCGCWDV